MSQRQAWSQPELHCVSIIQDQQPFTVSLVVKQKGRDLHFFSFVISSLVPQVQLELLFYPEVSQSPLSSPEPVLTASWNHHGSPGAGSLERRCTPFHSSLKPSASRPSLPCSICKFVSHHQQAPNQPGLYHASAMAAWKLLRFILASRPAVAFLS